MLNKQAKVWLGAWCYARIRCGFPVKKSISVRIRYRSGGLWAFQDAVRVRCGGGGAVLS